MNAKNLIGENPPVLFEMLLSVPSETIFEILKEENEQAIALLFDTWQKNEKTILLYERMKPFFPAELPPLVKRVKLEILQDLERVLERKLAAFQSEY